MLTREVRSKTLEVDNLAVYHHIVDSVVSYLGSDGGLGLSPEKIEASRLEHGDNCIKMKDGRHILLLLLDQFLTPITAILLGVFILNIITKEYVDSGVIMFLLFTNAILGWIQEVKAQSSLAKLKSGHRGTVLLCRGGTTVSVDIDEVVVGDIMLIKEGDVVYADGMVVSCDSLEVDESLLTGESVSVAKVVCALDVPEKVNDLDIKVAVGDRVNMVFRQTLVTQGYGRVVVTAVGYHTKVGQLTKTLEEPEVQSPVYKSVNQFLLGVFCAALLLVGMVFLITMDASSEVVTYAAAGGIAVFSESLYAVVTVALTLGTRSLAKCNAIVRKIGSVERLGRITNICSDKTGTLTEGKMSVKQIWAYNDNPQAEILQVLSLCNNTKVSMEDGVLVGSGNATELAMQKYAYQQGIIRDELDEKWIQLKQWPFDSSVKRMTVLYCNKESKLTKLVVKGAPEVLIELCENVDKDLVAAKVEQFAKLGFRVQGCASKLFSGDANVDRAEIELGLTFLGLVCVYDPPKQSSIMAVRECKTAGITFHMVTGDHIGTASAIAQELGILEPGWTKDMVTTGPVFDATSMEALLNAPLPRVVARCSPDSKVKLLELIKLVNVNAVVAMTGDGANDGPAIKRADIGVAMGLTGADVTKAVADVVLTDDNMGTLVAAVRVGRATVENLKKVLSHLMLANIVEFFILAFFLFLRDDDDKVIYPVSALGVLFINTLTSAPPAIGLAADLPDPMAMLKPPPTGSLFTTEVVIDQIMYGLIGSMVSAVSYIIPIYTADDDAMFVDCNHKKGKDTCRTIWEARATLFTTINMLLLVQGYICRFDRRYMFQINLVENRVLLASTFFGVALVALILYVPWLATLFKVYKIDWQWGVVAACVAMHVILTDVYKLCKNLFWHVKLASADMPLLQKDDGMDDQAIEMDNLEQTHGVDRNEV